MTRNPLPCLTQRALHGSTVSNGRAGIIICSVRVRVRGRRHIRCPATDPDLPARTDLATADTVGQINDLVLAEEGTGAAIVIGVGGLQGTGKHAVAATMDQIGFASDVDGLRAFYILIQTLAAMLKDLPRFDRWGVSPSVAASGTAAPVPMLAAPDMTRFGHGRAKATDMLDNL